MNDPLSWYRTLDLDPGSTPDQVREAWRDLAQVWHPDRFSGNPRLQGKAEETLKRVNEAYENLKKFHAASSSTASGPPPKRPNPYEPETFQAATPEIDPLELLAEGVQKWNLFRRKYSDYVPKLPRAKLQGRPLEGVDFREVDLTAVDLRNADLYKANLSEAILVRARMEEADLNRAHLLSAQLVRADLVRADLSAADLRGANLSEAHLEGANLVGARLEGVDLSNARGLETQQIELASIDASTRLPNML